MPMADVELLQAESERLLAEGAALREALEDIRSRSAMNSAMRPDPFELTARLGDIYQIADAAIAKATGQKERRFTDVLEDDGYGAFIPM
jgi:hypothetical protein